MKKILFCFSIFLTFITISQYSNITYALEENIDKKEQEITVEDNISIQLNTTYSLNVSLNGNGTLTYYSHDNDIASIDDQGVITAKKAGKTSITIIASETEEYQETQKTITITVTKITPTITASNITKTFGDPVFNINAKTDSDSPLYYQSSHSDIAEVDENGNIKINKTGTTTITIKTEETENYIQVTKEITLIVKSTLSNPSISNISFLNNEIQLNWNKVDHAQGYILYRRDNKGEWKKVITTNQTHYIDKNVKSSVLYQYKLVAFSDNENNISDESQVKEIIKLIKTSLSLSNISKSIQINWNKTTGCQGYYIYRKTNTSKGWKLVNNINGNTVLSWKDTSVSNGNVYYYTIKAYYKNIVSPISNTKYIYRIVSPKITKYKKDKTKLNIKWNKNTKATGYQLQYSTSSLFLSNKTIKISNFITISKNINKLSKNKTYYLRIRTYKRYKNKTYYSTWSLTSNIKNTKKVSLTKIKIKKKDYELRTQTKQTLYQYDTVQGGCTDGKYAYYVMYNRKVEKCKLVKIRLSNMKLVKVSSILNIAHGNDITYNKDTKKLIAVHTRVNKKRISIIDPNTLKVEKYQDISIPTQLAGTTTSQLKTIKAFWGIKYNASKKQYVVLLKNCADFLILNKNMEPIHYIKASKKDNQMYQGLDITDDYILVIQSFKGNKPYNIISVYDWEGNYITKINTMKGYEIENVFHIGKQFYATFYTSYYKIYYTKEKQTKIVKGKKKTVTVKVKHKKLMRDNYIYKIKEI